MVGGGGVRAKSERPNFLRPYLPNGSFGQCPRFGSFFFMAPLTKLGADILQLCSHILMSVVSPQSDCVRMLL